MSDCLLKTGIIGAVGSAICCFTPVLPWLFGVFGLSGMVGYVYRDDVLLTILAASIVVTGGALWKKIRTQ